MILIKNISKGAIALAVMCIAFSVAGAQETTTAKKAFEKVIIVESDKSDSTGVSFTNVVDEPIFVDLPDQGVRPRSSLFVVPITVGDLTDKHIISFDFEIQFDPTLISPIMDAPTTNDGTLSRNFMITVNPYLPGRILVSGFGPYPMTSEGVLLNLNFQVVGHNGCNTLLTWQRFMFNEGNPASVTTDGRIWIKKR